MSYKNETRRQQNERINNLLNSIPKETEEDRNKIYSWNSIKNDDILKEIHQLKKGGYGVRWCKECNSFTCHQVNNCCICKSKKTGLGNPEIHAKTIKSQLEKGTFNMMNPEVQKNKVSNKNLNSKIEDLFCEKCNEITKHKVWENGKTNCCKCNAQNNGSRMKYCNVCKKETMHNGSICNECNPKSAVSNNIHYEFCKTCNKITLHNGKICLDCNKEKDFRNNTHYEYCNICKKGTFHNGKICTVCHPEIKSIGFKNCNKCKKITYHIGNKCTVCYPDSMPCSNKPNFTYEDVLYYKNEPVYKIIQKLESGEYNLKDFPGWNKRWCENCNKYEYHYEKECLVCGEVNKLSNSNFTERNGVKYYKNIEINEFCNKIISDEFNCSDYSGINIRFGHVCYGTENIVTGKHYYLSGSNFQLVEGFEFILNPMTGQREPSEEFYRRYQDKINSVNPSEEIQNLISNEGFTLEAIITTGPDSWSRSRTDKYLSNKGYGWIVYIKLLNGHPWIVGKTGTMTVSKSPIDFNFIITDKKSRQS